MGPPLSCQLVKASLVYINNIIPAATHREERHETKCGMMMTHYFFLDDDAQLAMLYRMRSMLAFFCAFLNIQKREMLNLSFHAHTVQYLYQVNSALMIIKRLNLKIIDVICLV